MTREFVYSLCLGGNNTFKFLLLDIEFLYKSLLLLSKILKFGQTKFQSRGFCYAHRVLGTISLNVAHKGVHIAPIDTHILL